MERSARVAASAGSDALWRRKAKSDGICWTCIGTFETDDAVELCHLAIGIEITHHINLHITDTVAFPTTSTLIIYQAHTADFHSTKYLEQCPNGTQVSAPGLPAKNKEKHRAIQNQLSAELKYRSVAHPRVQHLPNEM